MTELIRIVNSTLSDSTLSTVEEINARYKDARVDLLTLERMCTDMSAMERHTRLIGRDVPLSFFEAYARLSELAIMVARMVS